MTNPVLTEMTHPLCLYVLITTLHSVAIEINVLENGYHNSRFS